MLVDIVLEPNAAEGCPRTDAHATASSIDFKKTSSHLSKMSKLSSVMTKPISFHQWLVEELRPRDESATEADAAFHPITATSGMNDSSVIATSSAATRLIRETASSAYKL